MKRTRRRAQYQFPTQLERKSIPAANAIIKRMHANQSRNAITFSHSDGPQTAVDLTVDHLARVFGGEQEPLQLPRVLSFTALLDDISFHQEDIEALTRHQMPPRKAPGCGNVTGAMLKPTMSALACLLEKLFTVMLCASDWRTAQVVPIYKKKGSRAYASNYRPISLTTVLYVYHMINNIRNNARCYLVVYIEEKKDSVSSSRSVQRRKKQGMGCRIKVRRVIERRATSLVVTTSQKSRTSTASLAVSTP
ncbi:hypothetical protein BCR43DRAFT_489842 [Syncephalastrum racemosum]|uniref:Uncharacterized protein n=1 Tax=Syncephalastrum racemosum TaxID=13706 RepID=A0A1X2HEX2_SYNRA|nr:hypothetical protein BCR43DRAFT_489842 [Syncephalastrum racemosum]